MLGYFRVGNTQHSISGRRSKIHVPSFSAPRHCCQIIEGFALPNNNYKAAVYLLKEMFGQTHTNVSSHMQTLLDLPAPRHYFGELENFVDQIETNVRGLAALGQSEKTYGGLLVPIILGKLFSEIFRNMTREHGESSWTLAQLRKALHKEVCILQAGQRFQKSETKATASFLTRAEPRWNSNNGQRHWPTQFPQKDVLSTTTLICQTNVGASPAHP